MDNTVSKKTPYFDDIFVTTDSKKISKIAEDFGIKVPYLRPANLAQDNTPTVDVIMYVLDKLKDLEKNMIILLY